MMKRKVLLMGASGSGKTSMRSVIFSNSPASLTSRLGVTIDVEQNHVRFLGDLILNLWDCGGQDSFMNSYLSTQQQTIFSSVAVLIYVFDLRSSDPAADMEYFRRCTDALRRYSPDAHLFLLVHKMDLAREARETAFEKKRAELVREADASAPGLAVSVFGTSIYDESLYKAWSQVVHTLIPNAAVLSRHLTTFAEACSATEVVLFERTTFLVIATSSLQQPPAASTSPVDVIAASPAASLPSSHFTPSSAGSSPPPAAAAAGPISAAENARAAHALADARYERTSELVKLFKHACGRVRSEFRALEFSFPEFAAVLDELTKNMYVLVVVHDPTVETAAIRLNIQLARKKFEELQGNSILGR